MAETALARDIEFFRDQKLARWWVSSRDGVWHGTTTSYKTSNLTPLEAPTREALISKITAFAATASRTLSVHDDAWLVTAAAGLSAAGVATALPSRSFTRSAVSGVLAAVAAMAAVSMLPGPTPRDPR